MAKKKKKKKGTSSKEEQENGDAIDMNNPSLNSISTSASSPSDLAYTEKIRGNDDFKKGDYQSAAVRYTKAIALTQTSITGNTQLVVSLFTNRAITNMHLKEYKKAIEDCQRAMKLDPRYTRALICHAFANFYVQNYEQTFEDLEIVSKLQTNRLLQQDLEKAKDVLVHHKARAEALKIKSSKMPIEVETPELLKSFNLLGIDEEETAGNVSQPLQPSKEHLTTKPKEEFLNLPLLVPVGEGLSKSCSSTCSIELPKKDAEERAAKEKELGNRAFSDSNYPLALIHYSKAIRLNWREAVFFSNRALVYLKMNRFYESISDCTASIDRKPSIKAYARRAAAWASLSEYFLAAEDYKKALTFEPRNTDCLGELEKCLMKLEEEYKRKLENDHSNEKLKKSLHNVREDLKRIAMKKDSAQLKNAQSRT